VPLGLERPLQALGLALLTFDNGFAGFRKGALRGKEGDRRAPRVQVAMDSQKSTVDTEYPVIVLTGRREVGASRAH
jgi:hypothetical protein